MASPVKNDPLPYIVFNGKRLRLAWLETPNTLYVDGINVNDPLQVLFVAADVLALSAVPSKNHCRIHARYAKEGLATKIIFTGTPLSRCSSGMWFYSIKGLFKVAFEYLSEDFQKFCLLFLKDWWLSALHEPQVSEEISIFHLKSVGKLLPDGRVMEEKGESSHLSIYRQMIESGQLVLGSHISGTAPQEQENIQNLEAESVYVSDDVELLTVSVQTESHEADKHECFIDVFKSPIEDLLNQVKCFIESHNLQIESREYYECDALITFLTFYKSEILHSLEPSIFPVELLKYFVSQCNEGNFSEKYSNDFGMSVRKNAMLCLVAEWVGDQFNELSTEVDQKVVAFKKKHISCINNLPPACDIISDIFPQSMSLLLVHWMANKDNETELKDTESCLNENREICPSPSKKPRISDHLEFMEHLMPLVQVILEFANRSLISGVAHVIYAQLIQRVK